MSVEELPDELDKLEIAPILPTLKMADQNLPLRLNPFYDDLKSYASSETALEHHSSRLPPNCRRCRLRRRSESVLDDYKVSAAAQLGGDYDTIWSTRSTPRLQRTSLKKSPNSAAGSGRKLLIREPVLRALQTCCARRKLLPNATDDIKLGIGSTAVTSTSGGSSSSNNTTIHQPVGGEKGISDFRDLIKECQTLLEQDVAFSGRLNQLSLGNKKNFTTMRSPCGPKVRSGAGRGTGHISDTGGGSHATASTLSLSSSLLHSSTSPTPLSEFNSLTILAGTSTAAAGPSTSRALHSNNNSSSNNTSCSQQAGNGCANTTTATNAAGDDVTIDELASYFDTFVHIPKKMSTMAEMMYI